MNKERRIIFSGLAWTLAVPNPMRLRGWSDNGQDRVAMGSGITVKQMDEGEGDAFMLTSLDMISKENINQLVR